MQALIQNANALRKTNDVSSNLSSQTKEMTVVETFNGGYSSSSKNKIVKIPRHIIQDLPLTGCYSVLLGRHIARLGLDLLQHAPAGTAASTLRINTLRVAAIFLATGRAIPHILVIDLVGVFCGYVDLSAVYRVILHCFGALLAPALEAGTVGVVTNVGNHIVGEVAVFMSECVDEPVFAINDLLGQLDRRMVSDPAVTSCLAIWSMRNHSLPSPMGPTGGCLECF